MDQLRKSEKRGWLFGWVGAFLWVFVLAVVSLAEGALLSSLIGFVLLAAGLSTVAVFSPWRQPRLRYRILMLPIYALFFISMGWAIWMAGGPAALGITPWSLLLLLPLLLPFFLMGDRRWMDGEQKSV